MTLLQRLGRALGHPANTYFYQQWATAHTTSAPPRRPDADATVLTDAEAFS
jgi:hypothetical protein